MPARTGRWVPCRATGDERMNRPPACHGQVCCLGRLSGAREVRHLFPPAGWFQGPVGTADLELDFCRDHWTTPSDPGCWHRCYARRFWSITAHMEPRATQRKKPSPTSPAPEGLPPATPPDEISTGFVEAVPLTDPPPYRVAERPPAPRTLRAIRGPEDVVEACRTIGSRRWEEFHVLLLNARHEVLRRCLISRGSLNASIVHPRLCAAAHKRGYVAAAVMWCRARKRRRRNGHRLRFAT